MITGPYPGSTIRGVRTPFVVVLVLIASVSRSPLPQKRVPSLRESRGNALRFFSSRLVVPSVPALKIRWSQVSLTTGGSSGRSLRSA